MIDFDFLRGLVKTRIEFYDEAGEHARLLYKQTDDNYFLGKLNAYGLASENTEGLLWHIDRLEEKYVLYTQPED